VSGVAVMDKPRQVLITTTGSESGKTATITGTGFSGNPISETVALPNNSTVASVLSYATVTAITISSAAAGAMSAGTNGVATTPWVRLDEWAPSNVAIQCTASGTVNYTVQQTLDDPNSPTSPVAVASVTWLNHPDTNLVAATGTVQGNYAYLPLFVRVLLNSGTGTVTANFVQSGDTPA
jgi:hypothetical protein